MNPVRSTTPPLPDLTESLTCPITCEVPKDPVVAADGYLYERRAIENWLRDHDTSPMTGQPLVSRVLYSVHPLRSGLGGALKPTPAKLPAQPPEMPQSVPQEAKLVGMADPFDALDEASRSQAEHARSQSGIPAQEALRNLVAAYETSDELLQSFEPLPEILGPPLASIAQRAVDKRVRQNAVGYLGYVRGLDAVRATLAVAHSASGAEHAHAKAQLFGVVPRLQNIDVAVRSDHVDAVLQDVAQDKQLPEEVSKAAVWALVQRSQTAPVRRDTYARLRDIARDGTTPVATTAARALLGDAQIYDADYAVDTSVDLAATAQLEAVRTFVRGWKGSAR